jgi:endoglucanase
MRKVIILVAVLFLASCGNGEDTYNDYEPLIADEQPAQPYEQATQPPPDEPGIPMTPDFRITTATQRVADMRIGWNLGNTLDAHADGAPGWHWMGDGYFANTTVRQMETAWVGAANYARQGLIDAVQAAGFDTLRVPVTWHKAMDEDFNIREDWMQRVHEVVGFAYNNGMYVILNSHHDEFIFRFMDDELEDSLYAFERTWQQIAEEFRDYSDRLMFMGLNEPRTRGSAAEWSGGTPEERNNLNIHNQLFVDTVRASGGNNAERILLITTYAASTASAAQGALIVPTDTVEDRLIVHLHMYSPYEFALHRGTARVRYTWSEDSVADTSSIMTPLNLAHSLFVQQGTPVIITEMGALNRGADYIEYRAAWAYFYASHAASLGMPVIWWDNGEYWPTMLAGWGGWLETFGIFNRTTYELMHPQIVEALMRAIS